MGYKYIIRSGSIQDAPKMLRSITDSKVSSPRDEVIPCVICPFESPRKAYSQCALNLQNLFAMLYPQVLVVLFITSLRRFLQELDVGGASGGVERI